MCLSKSALCQGTENKLAGMQMLPRMVQQALIADQLNRAAQTIAVQISLVTIFDHWLIQLVEMQNHSMKPSK